MIRDGAPGNGGGYRILTARDGVEGVECFRKNHHRIDAVITDVVMPRMNGPAALAAMRELKPDLPAIVVSGYADAESTATRSQGTAVTKFIHKPYAVDVFVRTVATLVGTDST